jgi:hypothetical protein
LADATSPKLLPQNSFDPTSPVTIANTELIAAAVGSLTVLRFLRALVAALLPTPRRTRDTDKKKQRGEFHIHIAKLVYLDTHNVVNITTY